MVATKDRVVIHVTPDPSGASATTIAAGSHIPANPPGMPPLPGAAVLPQKRKGSLTVPTGASGRDVTDGSARPIERMVREYWVQEDKLKANRGGGLPGAVNNPAPAGDGSTNGDGGSAGGSGGSAVSGGAASSGASRPEGARWASSSGAGAAAGATISAAEAARRAAGGGARGGPLPTFAEEETAGIES
eukprot:gene368-57_t